MPVINQCAELASALRRMVPLRLRRVQIKPSMLETFYQMDVLGYIYDAQGLFSLFGRRLLELGSPGDKNVRYLAGLSIWRIRWFPWWPRQSISRCEAGDYEITQIIGPVVDCQCTSGASSSVTVAQALRARRVASNVYHLSGKGIVRGVALQGTQG